MLLNRGEDVSGKGERTACKTSEKKKGRRFRRGKEVKKIGGIGEAPVAATGDTTTKLGEEALRLRMMGRKVKKN